MNQTIVSEIPEDALVSPYEILFEWVNDSTNGKPIFFFDPCEKDLLKCHPTNSTDVHLSSSLEPPSALSHLMTNEDSQPLTEAASSDDFFRCAGSPTPIKHSDSPENASLLSMASTLGEKIVDISNLRAELDEEYARSRRIYDRLREEQAKSAELHHALHRVRKRMRKDFKWVKSVLEGRGSTPDFEKS
uniref:Uncharacterized protein n=1 Tax=Paramoeba aestuarina TaxID=180227 RepID=A0A7S4KTD9_9EUKA